MSLREVIGRAAEWYFLLYTIYRGSLLETWSHKPGVTKDLAWFLQLLPFMLRASRSLWCFKLALARNALTPYSTSSSEYANFELLNQEEFSDYLLVLCYYTRINVLFSLYRHVKPYCALIFIHSYYVSLLAIIVF